MHAASLPLFWQGIQALGSFFPTADENSASPAPKDRVTVREDFAVWGHNICTPSWLLRVTSGALQWKDTWELSTTSLQSSGKQLLWIKTKKAKRGPDSFRGSTSLVPGKYQALVLTSDMQKLWWCLLYQHEMSLFNLILLIAFQVKPQQPRY